MNRPSSRRRFLADVATGTLLSTLGPAMMTDLGLVSRCFGDDQGSAGDPESSLTFGALEPLVCEMQETPADALQPRLVQHLRSGTSVQTLVAAGALANARTFGGEDYIGFHTFMALAPALHMSELMPKDSAALPALKVLYRNANRIQDFGGRSSETLHSVHASNDASLTQADLYRLIKEKNTELSEQALAAIVSKDSLSALEALIPALQDSPEVHRTVLPYRAWDMQRIVGTEHATTLLRQSLRYCLRLEPHRRAEWDVNSKLLSELMDEFKLASLEPGQREMDDATFNALSEALASLSPKDAARAAATALSEGFNPRSVGEAISSAACLLVLRDGGRLPQWEDRLKPAGCVHGDSVGVHASDSANAWRNLAMVTRGQASMTCLLMGAWQVARDRDASPAPLLAQPLPAQHHLNQLSGADSERLLTLIDEYVQSNLQGHATAVAYRYAELGLPAKPLFTQLLKYAVSEDGALHAEKYFHTVWDDFHSSRPSTRARYLAALARVTASEYGTPAAGQEQARELLRST